jgi:hypothetical protein
MPVNGTCEWRISVERMSVEYVRGTYVRGTNMFVERSGTFPLSRRQIGSQGENCPFASKAGLLGCRILGASVGLRLRVYALNSLFRHFSQALKQSTRLISGGGLIILCGWVSCCSLEKTPP